MFSFNKYKKQFLDLKKDYEEIWDIASDKSDELKKALETIHVLRTELRNSGAAKKVAKKAATKKVAKKVAKKKAGK